MRTLRPRRSLGWALGATIAALGVPVLVTLLWVTAELGAWPTIVAAGVVVILLLAAAWWSYRRTAIRIGPNGLSERGFFGLTHRAEIGEIDEIIRLELYRAHSLDTSPQLFIVGRNGRRLLRMRGDFWEDEDLDTVSPLLGIRESRRPTPVTLAELRSSDPKLLYWFERIGPKA
ncbi:hypothetical protein [Agromyces archimandritae]|uniref:PH domain-containing protein n=1 Tax=Agromyces archimandritae TaxID=2781962 RepID=A0A975FKR8_9MICO|nr:hypothetical protein [Agromyces archimandritae]QTX03880.1 hypothetical protein G127AT_11225 [Agromyces archimandritae]